jgi:ATP-dependent helicase HrpA
MSVVWSLVPLCMLADRVAISQQLRRLQGRRQRDPAQLKKLKARAERSAALLKTRKDNPLKVTYPEELPITARREEIVKAIQEHPVVIVAGETGSGKTTQLPKMCLEAGRGVEAKIACTQPRRVAALSVSRRIAAELGVQWGNEVGCKIRFKDETKPGTRIKMMTDGMLLAEVQGDSDLFEYDTIIIDEAHERSLNIDFLLGYLRQLRERRPDLKMIITSATIDTQTFSKAFENAPIIEVSGRVYPVDIQYWSMDDLLGEDDVSTYIDAAVTAVDAVVAEAPRHGGDILVFMPTEKDIHETRRRLEGRQFRGVEVVPMFGRLTAGDQQKVFHTQNYRRIVVATNIAETSITIPGIRYVIDTGMARISRYNPRNQTHRLPVEPISQSSAKQRAGRCGRVANGVCIRLYDEKDFLSRPEYTQPEIQRSDLADVILRMISLNLGQIETFPFIDPPRPQAIQGGFTLLAELGALDEQKRLTKLGRDMSRLPIAPTVARMVLQAQKEQALKEVLVIASAISIQDPRVRPLGQEKEADQEHKKFVDKTSDFLTLLNIWNAYHGTMERLKTQSQMRRFCVQHFLSFNRMREWRDIYMQIRHTLREIGGFRFNQDDADFDSIHRSILSGLLSNVAQKKEGNNYRAARGRDVMLFPGSGLFLRRKEEEKEKLADAQGKEARTPGWVIAGEMVETSRLFARTVAQVQPQWLVELGGHLCKATYKEPFYSLRSGRVLATETLTLHGLQIQKKRVGYGKIDPVAATEVFIREALVNDEVTLPHEFLSHNRDLRERVETWQMRQRHTQFLDLDEAVYRFYAARLDDVSATHDLNRLVRDKGADYLIMIEADLSGGDDVAFDRGSFPEYLEVEGQQIPLVYAYRPGQDEDGVTLKLPYKMMHFVQRDTLEWLVPGLLEEKITHLLRGLPKGIRKQFVPVPEKAQSIAVALQPTHGDFLASLSAHILSRYGVETSREDWQTDDLPEHLRMRVEVQGEKEETLASDRDLALLRERLNQLEETVESDAWTQAVTLVARTDVKGSTLGALPERVEVSQTGGMTVFGYVGLQCGAEGVDVRLYNRPDEAENETRAGWIRLCERELRIEMKALKRSLGELKQTTEAALFEGGSEALREAAYENLVAFLFDKDAPFPLTTQRFEIRVKEARVKLQYMLPQLLGALTSLFETYREICLMPGAYPELEADVSRLMPSDFLRRSPFDQLPHLSRFLKAIQMRAERAKVDPRKDFQKAEVVNPFQGAVDTLLDSELSFAKRTAVEQLRWMLEELRVSVFAQELGTAQKVSPKRLSDQLERVRRMA